MNVGAGLHSGVNGIDVLQAETDYNWASEVKARVVEAGGKPGLDGKLL